MTAPTLNDYEFQYKDVGNGVLLNGSNDELPFWDVTETDGFVGLPEIAPIVYDRDGRDGSSVYVKFMKHRALTVQGSLYAPPATFDLVNSVMSLSMRPDGSNYPLYFQLPGLPRLFYKAVPVGYSCSLDQGRRTGSSKFQAQWISADPRAYNGAYDQSLTSGVAENVNNVGNVESYPIWKCSAANNTAVTIRVANETEAKWVQYAFTTPPLGDCDIEVDTALRCLRVDGVLRPGTFTTIGGWPSLRPGANSCKITLTNATAGSIAYQSAWLL